MKLLIINVVCGIRSTGRIVTDIALDYEQKGYEVKIAYGRESVPEQYQRFAVRIGNDFQVKMNALSCRLFDNDGFSAKLQTKEFLDWASEYDPDELWLHNLHGYYINVEMLFAWIKSRPNMKVKWTIHDCWAFTGHCSHFTAVKCDKWKHSCDKCPLKKEYPASLLLDASKSNYVKKKNAFLGVRDMTIVSVSHWLENLIQQGFLGEYPISVIYNKVDETIFHHRDSDFRDKYGLRERFVVLGVASTWTAQKGLDDFVELSKRLDDKFKIVLIGLTKAQIEKIPENILGFERTESAIELAEIYSAADLFINPSKEETFGLTSLEAQMCGTKAVVYKDTACEEIADLYGGIVVEQSVDELYKTIIQCYSVQGERVL